MDKLYYLDWEMYIIIIISYLFGFLAGYMKAWILLISLIILIIPFYMFSKRKNKND